MAAGKQNGNDNKLPRGEVGGMAVDTEARWRTSDLTQHISIEVRALLERYGVAEYCLGISVEKQHSYYTAGGVCGAADVSEPSRYGYRLGCMFRPFLAATALELVHARHLELATPIGEYFPELRRTCKSRNVTLSHIISHTAGYIGLSSYGSAHAFTDRVQALEDIRKSPQLFPPGHVFNYEHSSTGLLGELLERVTGLDARLLVERMVFEKFGIADVRQQLPSLPSLRAARHGIVAEKGRNLLSRALLIPDVLTVMDAIMWSSPSMRQGNGFSFSTSELLQNPVIAIPRIPGTIAWKMLATGSTLGLHVYRNGIVGYEGNTGTQAIGFRFDPKRKWAVALGINKPGQEVLRRAVFGAILNIVETYHGSSMPPTVDVDRSYTFTPGEIVGDYFGDHNLSISVLHQSNGISLRTRWGRKIAKSRTGFLSAEGIPRFDATGDSVEPCFYRLPSTGDTCVVLGMCTWKRYSGWRRAVGHYHYLRQHREMQR